MVKVVVGLGMLCGKALPLRKAHAYFKKSAEE